jgi:uncharacterized membrane protein (UPF0182 family)
MKMEKKDNNPKVEVAKAEINKKTNETKKKVNKTRRIVVLFVLLFFVVITGISLRAEYLNYLEIGETYISVLIQKIQNKYIVLGTVFVTTYIFIYVLNKFIIKGLKKFFDEEKKEMPKLPNKSLSLVVALLSGTIASSMLADKLAIFNNAGVFGIEDPIFRMDIGYYMFTLPFIQTVLMFCIGFFIVTLIYIALYFVIALNSYFDGVDGETLKKNTFVKLELFVVILLAIAFCTYIFVNAQNILTGNMVQIGDENTTSLVGAGKSDVTVKLWGYRILSFVIAVSVIRLLSYVKKGNFKQGIISVLLVPTYLLILFVVLIGFQAINVGRNELDSEKDYIAFNIDNTKKAYNIDINQQNIDNYTTITSEQVENNQDVINNIPLITEDVTLTTVAEHQENSVYYNYENTFLALYKINGSKELVYITPREILTDNTISYNNKSLKYTHGYSAVVSSATDTDETGYAKYILSDFTSQDILNIKQPRIYFGLETNSLIKTNTSFGKEYDYPITASKYEENTYNGKAGLNLGFLDRLVLAINQKDFRLALSTDITKDTKIVLNRNVIERAKKILPDVLYDENPYLVITDEGKLVWVLDGYTRSCNYPYSQISTIDIKGYKERLNYIRNSVKVLIDAYDGTTTFYITDKSDPIIMTYRNMYPDLFTEKELPNDIKEHLVYPKFLYNIQANMVNIYHDISEDTLYRADDIWQITTKANSANSKVTGVQMQPYYTMLKTIDSDKPELGLVITYNKLEKQNITSYLVGTVENGKSELALYKFNSESNVVGILQLNNQIEQDERISKELETINTSGTKLIKDMIIVPINKSLLYVEPVYQVMLNESEIPVLRKVIVASGNTVAIGDTLDSALKNLFNDAYAVDLEFVNVEDITALVDSVIKANNNLKESLNANNFELIGKDITNLQAIVNQLENARKIEIEKENEKKQLNNVSNTNSVAENIVNNNTVNQTTNVVNN